MDVRSYVESLINMYTECSKYPICQLISFDKGITYQIRFNSSITVYSYNLGFKLRSICWIGSKLALKNIKILETILLPENSELLFSVIQKRNKLILIATDRYGNKIIKKCIKYVSINV